MVACLDQFTLAVKWKPPPSFGSVDYMQMRRSMEELEAPNTIVCAAKRVASVDVFRGLAVVMMILVDDAGREWPMIGHAPWNGCNLADFVMPFFLFIVGIAVALSLKRIQTRPQAVRKVVLRSLKLFLWGILLQGGYLHASDKLTHGVNMKFIRWCGILQRISLAYLLVALLEIFSKSMKDESVSAVTNSIFRSYCWNWIFGSCLVVVYLCVLYGISVPNWNFTVHNQEYPDYGQMFTVKCGVRGKLDPACNAAGYVDRELLGINHMYQHPAWRRSKACTESSPFEGHFRRDAPPWCQAPFEPEGIISSISATLSATIGVHFGHVLVLTEDHLNRLRHWCLMGLSLLTLGIVFHCAGVMPLNKQLYSLSYVCLTAGVAALVFSAIYILVDVASLRYLFLPMEWVGMNAMLIYVMAAEGIFSGFLNGWYYEKPHNTLVHWIQKHFFIKVWHSERVGILLYVIFAEIAFWSLIAGILHRSGIYWKL